MTGTGTHDARQFLASVDAACGDLAAADRARLLGGLEEHLAELSAEGVREFTNVRTVCVA